MTLGFLGKATFLYAVGNICLRAASFLLIPIYAHYLAIEDYGLLMTLLLTIQFMLVAMNCGTEHSVVRFAKHYEKNSQLSSLMGTTFVISLIASIIVACICLTLLLPFFQAILHRQEVYWLIGYTLVSAFFQSMCDLLTSYYRSQGQPVKYMIVGVVTALILTVFSFIFLCVLKMGINGALLAKVIAYACVFGVISWQIYSKTGFKVSLKLAPKLFHFGMPLALSGFGQFAITGASIYFLSLLSGLESVAVFSLGHKLASVLMMVLVIPFQLSFQPYVFSQLDLPDIKRQVSRLLTYLMYSIAIGSYCVLFAARLLIPLIAPPEYAEAFIVTLLIVPAMAMASLFYYGETLLKAAQKSYIIGMIVIVCAVLSLIANFILIYYISWYGALLATNVTFLVLGGSIFCIGIKEYSVPIEWRRLRIGGGLFLGVLLINLILLKSTLYLYSVLNLVFAGAILLFLIRSTLWDQDERRSARKALKKLKSFFQKAPPEHIESNIA